MNPQQTMTPCIDAGARPSMAQRERTKAPLDGPSATVDGLGQPGPLPPKLDLDPDVIVFNQKQRYTGVSATENALVAVDLSQWRLGYCCERLSNGLTGMMLGQAVRLSRKTPIIRVSHVPSPVADRGNAQVRQHVDRD